MGILTAKFILNGRFVGQGFLLLTWNLLHLNWVDFGYFLIVRFWLQWFIRLVLRISSTA